MTREPAPVDTRRRLGWPLVLRALADRTRTALGREGAEGLSPLPDREAVLGRLGRIAAMRELHRLGESLPLAGVPDVRPHVTHAGKEGLLEGPALREVATVLRAASETARLLGRFPDALGEIRARWPELGGLSELARRIETAIAPDGEVADAASPALAEARARVRGLHERLRRQAEALVQSREWADALQEAYFTVRGDRYVLPVKAAFRYQAGGIVHNVSNTGQTVFVEPPALVEAGNELALATAEVAEETRRVLQGLTGAVRDAGDKVLDDLRALGALDLLEAMARLAGDLDASSPEVPWAAGAFSLRGLRHPLLVLQGKRVIPNDLAPEASARCLVVSGPNAGGKTVTVTAVALCALLVRHGLPVPAEPGSVVPLYPVIRAVVGDEQDLERDLSSFSAHLQELRRVLEDAGDGALVLVDEICADTDPREGAALAVAVLEALLDRGARVLVTTHLAALKALAATDDRFLAAAVGFDAERMSPTYRLRLHASAGSSALEVASRVGLPGEVVEAARRHLSGDEGSLANALRDLAASQAEAAREADRLRAAQAELAQAEARVEAARADLEAERRSLRTQAQETLLEDIETARRQVKQTVAELQAKPKMRQAGEVDRQLEEMAKAARAAVARQQEAEAPATGTGTLQPGSFVRVPSLGDKDAEVLEVGAHDALVALGALKTRVPLDHLVPLRRPPKAQPARRIATPKAQKLANAERARGGPVNEAPPETIDLRGQRVDEALAELTRRLDRLFAEGALRAVVIHGHGTGALKQAVRDYLASAPYASSIRPGDRHEGGDGVTVVEMG